MNEPQEVENSGGEEGENKMKVRDLMLKCYACNYGHFTYGDKFHKHNYRRCPDFKIEECLEHVDEYFKEECPMTWDEWGFKRAIDTGNAKTLQGWKVKP